MNRWVSRFALLVAFCVVFPRECPAPLIYRPGEGWTYEAVGREGAWRRQRAEEQLAVAQEAYDKGDFGLALKAARRVVKAWPLSDYAPKAQFLIGLSREARKQDHKAFQEYQKVLKNYPNVENYESITERQFEIADRFLAGQWFKLWGYVPFFPSMDKTAKMFETMVETGPYSEMAPQAQLKIGHAREKQKDFPKAAEAYETAADRYHDRKKVAADAMFLAGSTYLKQAKSSEYDQNIAGRAIATFSDFIALHPDDERVEEARVAIQELRTEQARGSFQIARFYEKKHQWQGALVYYNEVLLKDPESEYAAEAKDRIATIKRRTEDEANDEP